MLHLELRHPADAFLYRMTTPRLRIDGHDVPVDGWGPVTVPVTPGRHRIQIHVPYALPRRAARVDQVVAVPSGGDLTLEYLASTLTFAKGSLGVPGRQTSAGLSAVRRANVIAVVLVALGGVAWLLFR